MPTTPTHIRLYGTATDSIVDGIGLRFSVFTQGCPHQCSGCHNPESQLFEGGTLRAINELATEIEANRLIQGVTLSGGEPLEQAEACFVLARRLKEKGLNIWIYTGYLFEDIIAGNLGEAAKELLSVCDVLVDGPFVESLHSYDLQWRGSSNQRIIDLPSSLEQRRAVLWQHEDSFPEAPASW